MTPTYHKSHSEIAVWNSKVAHHVKMVIMHVPLWYQSTNLQEHDNRWTWRIDRYLQMKRLSWSNNRLRFKISEEVPVILAECRECTSNLWRKHWKMSICNRLDLETCTRISTNLCQKSPLTLMTVWLEGFRWYRSAGCWPCWLLCRVYLQ